VGYADALLARELPDGTLQLIDGHLRAETTPEMEVPVLVVDLDEREAAKLLAVHDPLAGLAEANRDALAELMEQVETENEAVRALLDQTLLESNVTGPHAEAVELRPLDIKRPPRMTWVLVRVPTVRFGEIAEAVESLAAMEGVTVESTSNDGLQD
jgi:ParB-like chromosome segregation protein Spo0J